jgi:hypothetical protein
VFFFHRCAAHGLIELSNWTIVCHAGRSRVLAYLHITKICHLTAKQVLNFADSQHHNCVWVVGVLVPACLQIGASRNKPCRSTCCTRMSNRGGSFRFLPPRSPSPLFRSPFLSSTVFPDILSRHFAVMSSQPSWVDTRTVPPPKYVRGKRLPKCSLFPFPPQF